MSQNKLALAVVGSAGIGFVLKEVLGGQGPVGSTATKGQSSQGIEASVETTEKAPEKKAEAVVVSTRVHTPAAKNMRPQNDDEDA